MNYKYEIDKLRLQQKKCYTKLDALQKSIELLDTISPDYKSNLSALQINVRLNMLVLMNCERGIQKLQPWWRKLLNLEYYP